MGKLSGVEPTLVKLAFEVIKSTNEDYQDLALEVVSAPVVVQCEHCGSKSEVGEYDFSCKSCGLPTTVIVSGFDLSVGNLQFVTEKE